MNSKEASVLINDISETWIHCDIDRLKKYYHTDFTGNYYGETVQFQDLMERLNYIEKHQKQRKIKILDIISDQNKIAIRFHYEAIDDQDGTIDNEFSAIYHFNDDKQIIHAWAYANQTVNYHR